MALIIKVRDNWRVIVRLSLDHDKNSSIRNTIALALESAGIRRTKTGTWESKDAHCAPAAATKQLQTMLKILENLHKTQDAPHALLDHLWIYVDRVR